MAQIFMKIDGIEGGTTDPDSSYAKNFEVETVSFGGSYNIDSKSFVPTGGKIVEPITVTIKHDKNLGSLYEFFKKGRKDAFGVELVWRIDEASAVQGLKLTLKDALIAAINTNVTDTAGTTVDVVTTLTFVFKSVKIEATDDLGTGGGEGEIEVIAT